jgi:NADH:ubiquinone oxidoreductase subunit 4 (subunit M)
VTDFPWLTTLALLPLVGALVVMAVPTGDADRDDDNAQKMELVAKQVRSASPSRCWRSPW